MTRPDRPAGEAIVIAIDGPAAAGKGTLARRLAAHYGLAHLDTGQLYRAVARKLIESGAEIGDAAAAERAARQLSAADLGDVALRAEAVGNAASAVAAMPGVRAALLAFQRDFARRPPHGRKGAVLDGRDIGTVVCPEAHFKFFVTAGIATRARRRRAELQGRGIAADENRIAADMARRDAQDAARAVAPLAAAPDAVILNTDEMGPDAVFRAAVSYIEGKPGRRENLTNARE